MDHAGGGRLETADSAQADVGMTKSVAPSENSGVDRPADVVQTDLEQRRDREQELRGVRTRGARGKSRSNGNALDVPVR